MYIKVETRKNGLSKDGNFAIVTIEITGNNNEQILTQDLVVSDPALIPTECSKIIRELNNGINAKERLAKYIKDNPLGEIDLAGAGGLMKPLPLPNIPRFKPIS
jgi:hypothetical protein